MCCLDLGYRCFRPIAADPRNVSRGNPDTDEELECRVVFLGDAGDRGQRVGVEFLSPAPRFWGLEFDGSISSN